MGSGLGLTIRSQPPGSSGLGPEGSQNEDLSTVRRSGCTNCRLKAVEDEDHRVILNEIC